VFTWNPRFADLPNVREIGCPNHFVNPQWPEYEERDIFSCLINANKRFDTDLQNDLYVERVAVIRWYEQNAPRHFELHGLGWNKPRHESGMIGRMKRRAQRLATQLFGYRPFPSWKGELADKSSALLRAKFAYCYENIDGLTGYVTDKVFDSLMNGCVPVYWGRMTSTAKYPQIVSSIGGNFAIPLRFTRICSRCWRKSTRASSRPYGNFSVARGRRNTVRSTLSGR
jgi:hypothetical protein